MNYPKNYDFGANRFHLNQPQVNAELADAIINILELNQPETIAVKGYSFVSNLLLWYNDRIGNRIKFFFEKNQAINIEPLRQNREKNIYEYVDTLPKSDMLINLSNENIDCDLHVYNGVYTVSGLKESMQKDIPVDKPKQSEQLFFNIEEPKPKTTKKTTSKKKKLE